MKVVQLNQIHVATDALLLLVYHCRHSNDRLYTGLKLMDSNEVWSDGTPVVNWEPHYGYNEPSNSNGFVAIRRDGYMDDVSSSRPYVCQVDATGKNVSSISMVTNQNQYIYFLTFLYVLFVIIK